MGKAQISIEQVEYMRDQRFYWLCTHRTDHPWYNKTRDEYVELNNTVIQYYNASAERRTKILAAVISGGIGLVAIGATTVISNSSLGAKFDSAMKGLPGRQTGNYFR